MVCCNVNDLEDTFRILATTFLPSQNECGISPGDRIYGGNITAVDEYPWTALIKYTSTRGLYAKIKKHNLYRRLIRILSCSWQK